MAALLIALRDVLVVLALNWIGVTIEPASTPAREPSAPESCATGGPSCTSMNGSISTIDCPQR